MTRPIVVDIPHQLGREEARRRIASRTGELASRIPGGAAQVDSHWPSEDQLEMTVQAMGQTVRTRIQVEDARIRVALDLPPMLGFVSGIIEGAVREQGTKFLAAPAKKPKA